MLSVRRDSKLFGSSRTQPRHNCGLNSLIIDQMLDKREFRMAKTTVRIMNQTGLITGKILAKD